MRILLHILVHLLVCILGLGLIAAAIVPTLLQHAAEWLVIVGFEDGGRLIIAGVGLAIAALPIAQFLRWWSRHRVLRELSYQTADGEITVSLVAVEEALERSLSQVEDIKKTSIDVREDRVRRQIVIEAVLSLWEDADIAVVNREAQALLRRRFAELMPEMPNCMVKVTVSRLSARRSADAARRTTKPTQQQEGANATNKSGRIPLPGLSATQGQVDSAAGAALLASSKFQPEPSSDVYHVRADHSPAHGTPIQASGLGGQVA